MKKNLIKFKKGFTILELMITIFIFAMMTSYLLARYGKFDQSMLLTNLAYDVALTLRTAQSYGMNVKSVPGSSNFDSPYGVHFDTSKNTCFIFFSDSDSDGLYNKTPITCSVDISDTEKISPYTIKRNSFISKLCAGSESICADVSKLDITFKRPDPNAIIYATDSSGTVINSSYAEILLQSSDGSTKKIIVRSTGQIAVQ